MRGCLGLWRGENRKRLVKKVEKMLFQLISEGRGLEVYVLVNEKM